MSTQQQDESAIHNIAQQLQDAWNAGDGDAFAAPFAEDSDYTVWNGHFEKGKAANAAAHGHLFSTVYAGTKQRMEVAWLRFIKPDIAVAQLHAGFVEADPAILERMPMSSEWPQVKPLLVLSKQAGGWQIESFQNTPILA